MDKWFLVSLFCLFFIVVVLGLGVEFDMRDIQYLKQTLIPVNLGKAWIGGKFYGQGFDLGYFGFTSGFSLGEWERVKQGYQYIDKPVGLHMTFSFTWLGPMTFWKNVIENGSWLWGDTWWEGQILFSWH